jgi:hypothetical protein
VGRGKTPVDSQDRAAVIVRAQTRRGMHAALIDQRSPHSVMRFWLLDTIRSYQPDAELTATKNVTLTEE